MERKKRMKMTKRVKKMRVKRGKMKKMMMKKVMINCEFRIECDDEIN